MFYHEGFQSYLFKESIWTQVSKCFLLFVCLFVEISEEINKKL